MKKTFVLALAIASMATTAAFAASVPVTDIQQGKSTVAGEYSFGQKVTDNGTADGYGVSLSTGLSDKLALQYSYHKTNLDKTSDIKDQQIAAVYRVHPNFNVYGAATYVDMHDHQWGAQFGVIGHTQLTDRVKGFAKVGFGNDVKASYQVGAAYELAPALDLNAYYGYDRYSIDDEKRTDKGFHVGLGYSF